MTCWWSPPSGPLAKRPGTLIVTHGRDCTGREKPLREEEAALAGMVLEGVVPGEDVPSGPCLGLAWFGADSEILPGLSRGVQRVADFLQDVIEAPGWQDGIGLPQAVL